MKKKKKTILANRDESGKYEGQMKKISNSLSEILCKYIRLINVKNYEKRRQNWLTWLLLCTLKKHFVHHSWFFHLFLYGFANFLPLHSVGIALRSETNAAPCMCIIRKHLLLLCIYLLFIECYVHCDNNRGSNSTHKRTHENAIFWQRQRCQ